MLRKLGREVKLLNAVHFVICFGWLLCKLQMAGQVVMTGGE